MDEIRTLIGGVARTQSLPAVTGYSIDTRTIREGDLFFAIRGPRFDGHDFVGEALARGARAAVVERDVGRTEGVLQTESVVVALQTLARAVRRRWAGPIVGVTGSAGKTTTKEMIARVLGEKHVVYKSVGNLNNEYGLPLCLLGLDTQHRIGVVEMGMSAKGEIRALAAIAEPNEGVVTNVNAVHLEFFASVDEIAEAKYELLEGLISPKRAYLNFDDARVRRMAGRFTGPVVSYGASDACDFRVSQIEDRGLEGSSFVLTHQSQSRSFTLPLLGGHNVSNAVAAVAVGQIHGVDWEAAGRALAGMKPEKMRGEVIRFQTGFTVINDAYNSNPRALRSMIDFLGGLSVRGRRWLVAGEMLELGPSGPDMHRDCGVAAVRSGIGEIVGVRGSAQHLLDGARDAGADAAHLRFEPDAESAGRHVAREVRPGDVVLIKGSRGVRLESVVEILKQSFPVVEA